MGENKELFFYVRLNAVGMQWKRLNFRWNPEVNAREVIEAAKRESELLMNCWVDGPTGKRYGYASWFWESCDKKPKKSECCSKDVIKPGKLIRCELKGDPYNRDIQHEFYSGALSQGGNNDLLNWYYYYKNYCNEETWRAVLNDMIRRGLLSGRKGGEIIIESDRASIDEFPALKSPENLFVEAFEELAKSYITYIEVLPSGVQLIGEEPKGGEGIFYKKAQVKEWYASRNFVNFGDEDYYISRLAIHKNTQVLMPLALLSSRELKSLRVDSEKLYRELRDTISIDFAAAIAGTVNPFIPLAVKGGEFIVGTNTPGIKDIVDVSGSGIDELAKLLFKLAGKPNRSIPFLSLGIALIERLYLTSVKSLKKTLQIDIDEQIPVTEAEEEDSGFGGTKIKWLILRETKLSVDAWRKYWELAQEATPWQIKGLIGSPAQREKNNLLKSLYEDYIPDDSYDALRMINKRLIDLKKYSEKAPYSSEENPQIGLQGYNYYDDVLKHYLGNPIAVLEFLRGWEFGSMIGKDVALTDEEIPTTPRPDIIKPGLWEEREDWAKEQFDTLSNNIKQLVKGTLRSTIYGEPFINTEPHPFNPAMPKWLWDEYDYLYMEMLEEQEEFEGSDAGGFGIGPMAVLPLLFFSALPSQDDTTSTQFAGSSPQDRLGSTPGFGSTPIAPMPSLSQPSIGKSGGGSGVGLGAYLLAPFKELAALSKKEHITPMPRRNRIGKFTERLFQIPQMLLTASPLGPLFAAGGTAGNLLGGLSEPQPAPQIVHRFEKGSVEIHTQKIDAKTLGDAFISFLREQSRQ